MPCIESAAAALSLDAEVVVDRLQEQQNILNSGISRVERWAARAAKKARVAGPAQQAVAYTILDAARDYDEEKGVVKGEG